MAFVGPIRARIAGADRFGLRMLILVGISFALLLAPAVGALYMASRAATAEGWIVHTMDVRRAARVVLIQLLDAETGERGFLLTEDEKFLEPFNRAERSVPGSLDRIVALASDNSAQLAGWPP